MFLDKGRPYFSLVLSWFLVGDCSILPLLQLKCCYCLDFYILVFGTRNRVLSSSSKFQILVDENSLLLTASCKNAGKAAYNRSLWSAPSPTSRIAGA